MPPAPGIQPAAVACLRSPLISAQFCASVGGTEHRCIFHTGVHGVGIAQRRLKMPHALELPRMRRAVVPLVRARHALIAELVAHRVPTLRRRRPTAA